MEKSDPNYIYIKKKKLSFGWGHYNNDLPAAELVITLNELDSMAEASLYCLKLRFHDP